MDKSVSHLEFWQAEYGVNSPTPTNLFKNNLVGWQYSNEGHFPQTTDLDIFSIQIYRSATRKKVDDTPSIITPTLPNPTVPKTSKTFNIGEYVKVKKDTLTYATGQEVPDWVKENIYTISQVSSDKVLLEPINSWFFKVNLEII